MSITTYVADTYEIMKKCKIYIKIQKIRRKYGIEFQMKGNRCIDTYNLNLEHPNNVVCLNSTRSTTMRPSLLEYTVLRNN